MVFNEVERGLAMDKQKPMKIVLIEDDVAACRDFADYARTRTDIDFVGMTGKSAEGLELVKNKLPEAVILDLELNMGAGSGYDFLEDFYKTEFSIRPIVVITTRTRNDAIHTQLHAKFDINWIFYKLQQGYCPEMVIRHLLRFREFYYLQGSGGAAITTLETPEEQKCRIMSRIKAEMDAFGISMRLKGRKYIEEAVYMLVGKKNQDSETLLQDVAKEQKNSYDNTLRAIQTAINDAWKNADDIDELLKLYTAPVRKDKGTPTPTEFIYYYADKIHRDLF
jgi:two-component system response regulator (stage 0 sporulation protein A)